MILVSYSPLFFFFCFFCFFSKDFVLTHNVAAHGGRPQRPERRGGNDRRREDRPEGSAELEVSNLHYDLNEDDLKVRTLWIRNLQQVG